MTALPDDLRTPLLEPYTRRRFGTGSGIDIEGKRWKFIWEAIFWRILPTEPEEKVLFIDLVGEIERCRHPRKWELAVEILDDAMAIETSPKESH
jgi:hypothetical protein